jgi:hypothetical protein
LYKCNSSTFLKSGSCLSSCGDAFYADTTNRACIARTSPCILCTISTVCTSCDNTTFLKSGSCVSSCGSGFYEDTTNRICTACISDCITCLDSSSCSLCDSNSYPNWGVCISYCQPGQHLNTNTNSFDTYLGHCDVCLMQKGLCTSREYSFNLCDEGIKISLVIHVSVNKWFLTVRFIPIL